MRERVAELVDEWRTRGPYFWADHQLLQAVLIAAAAGAIAFAFKWAELAMARAMAPPAVPA